MFIIIELILWALLCTLFISNEKGIAAGVTCLIGAGALWLSGFNVFKWAYNNPELFGQGLVAYLLVGFLWATFKFCVKMRKARNRYVRDKADYLSGAERDGSQRTEQMFIDICRTSYKKNGYAPSVNDNKVNILFWAWWWPFSIIAFLLEDLLRELVNFSWKGIKAVFEGIRGKLLGEAARDLD